jgi:membrane protease YdiL (CAAX protease family)
MRNQQGPISVPLFAAGACAISWPIWIWARQFHAVFHIVIAGWTFNIPQQPMVQAFGDIGPGVSATAVVALTEGWLGVRRLWSGLKNWRFPLVWILFVCVLFPLVQSVALLSYRLLGGALADTGPLLRWPLLILLNLPFAPLWEEIGWRGFLLPRLESKYSGLHSSAILACVWAPWHLAIYWGSSVEWWIGFVAVVFALSILFTWVYNSSRRRLLPVVLLHVMWNTTNMYLLGPTLRAGGVWADRFVIAFTCGVAVIVAFSVGPSLYTELGAMTSPDAPCSESTS